jgi:hypothetical protein
MMKYLSRDIWPLGRELNPRSPEYGVVAATFGRLLLKAKVKIKLSQCLSKHHAMKAYWGSADKRNR